MFMIRLLINWLFVLLSPLWILPFFVIHIGFKSDADDRQMFFNGKRFFWE